MAQQVSDQHSEGPKVTIEDVERVLAVGRLLLSVLTSEELDSLRKELAAAGTSNSEAGRTLQEIGNTGVT